MFKKLLVFGILVTLGMGVFTVLFPKDSDAAIYSRARWQGYFYDRRDTAGVNLYDGGIYTNNIDAFVGFYSSRVNHPDPRVHIPAAFTILDMLGAPPGTNPVDARIRFGEWERGVRWYSATGRINWAENYYFTRNTYLQNSVPWDVAWYYNTDRRDSIVFYNPDGTTYAIKKDCANPVGDASPIHVPPAPTANCAGMTPIATIESGGQANIVARVRYGNVPNFGPPSVWQGATMRITDLNTGVTTPIAITSMTPQDPPPGSPTIEIRGTTPVLNAGRYSVEWEATVVTPYGYQRTPVQPPPPSPVTYCGGPLDANANFFVASKPYFQVDNGDVLAGTSFSTANSAGVITPCPAGHITQAGIASYSNQTGTLGAGTDYAAFALGMIEGFATSQKNNAGGNPPPYTLAFSNDAGIVNVGAGLFGGMFGSIKNCVDYWGKKPINSSMSQILAASTNVSSMSTGKYYRNGPLELTGGNINPGQHVTLYVDGNVRISNNITYANPASWNSRDKIPSFKLIVRGSIYIQDRIPGPNPGVDTLDGIYVAVPGTGYVSAPNNTYDNLQPLGTISTCSRPGAFATYTPTDLAAVPSRCTQRLTVNGGFSANQAFLLRRGGSLSTPNSAAEVFNYSPEVWMTMDPDSSSVETFDSILGLPPVL